MAQTPESRAIALLEERDAIHRRYQEDVAGSESLHAVRLARHTQDRDADLAHLATVALELLSHTLKLDEREPEPVKPTRAPRPRLELAEVQRLLALPIPELAAVKLSKRDLSELLGEELVRDDKGRPAYIAHLTGRGARA